MEEAGRLLCFLSSLQPSIFSCKLEGDWVSRSSARCVQSFIAQRPFSPSPLTAAIGPRDRPRIRLSPPTYAIPTPGPHTRQQHRQQTDYSRGEKKKKQ